MAFRIVAIDYEQYTGTASKKADHRKWSAEGAMGAALPQGGPSPGFCSRLRSAQQLECTSLRDHCMITQLPDGVNAHRDSHLVAPSPLEGGVYPEFQARKAL